MQFHTTIYILLVMVVIKVSCDCGVVPPRENSPNSSYFWSEDIIFPWHVIIYYNPTGNKYLFSCVGTLISADVVITAALCCYDGFGLRKRDDGTLTVAAGKYYKPFDWPESAVQKSRVTTIHIARGFVGPEIFNENDIAWLILEHPFNLTPFVRPVCINFDNMSDTEEFRVGQIGMGVCFANSLPRFTFQHMELSVIPQSECTSKAEANFRSNITTDIFCATSTYDNIYNTESGTGIYFQLNGRWYLRGVFGDKYLFGRSAGENSSLILTNIRGFVDEMRRNTDIKKCGIAGPPANTLIVNGSRAERGSFPWHVAVYEKNLGQVYEQICAGSLISSNIVISAAHCFYDSSIRQKMDVSNFAVAAGKQNRPYNWPERFVQKSTIKTIHLPDRYYGLDGLYAEDIAWLILEHAFDVSMFVRPICIDGDNFRERQHLRSGSVGKAAGWGITANGSTSLELQAMNVPFVPYAECVLKLPRDFIPFIASDKFCGGYLNGTSLCDGDSGGGLAFQRDGRWYLRGIVSASPRSQGVCDSHLYTAFTNVGHYMDELQRLTNFTTHDLI